MAVIVVIATVCTLKSYSSLRDLVFPSEVLESDIVLRPRKLEKGIACADEKRLFVSFNIFSTDKINHVGYENVNVYTIDIGLM